MIEGWYGDDYLVLFEERAPALERAYGLTAALPGYRLVGLRSWDDFIVEDSTGARFTIPTVPLLPEHLAPFTVPASAGTSKPDDKLRGRIKWYITPIVFGGDPNPGDNVRWITIEEHAQLVTWWNRKYHDVREGRDGTPAA
jgi:hypothetical protein